MNNVESKLFKHLWPLVEDLNFGEIRQVVADVEDAFFRSVHKVRTARIKAAGEKKIVSKKPATRVTKAKGKKDQTDGWVDVILNSPTRK